MTGELNAYQNSLLSLRRAMPSFALLLASVPIVPAGDTFACTPTAVWDGGGPVWCAERLRERLAAVTAQCGRLAAWVLA